MRGKTIGKGAQIEKYRVRLREKVRTVDCGEVVGSGVRTETDCADGFSAEEKILQKLQEKTPLKVNFSN